MSETSELYDAHFQRGYDLYVEGNLAKAVTEWREASRIDPEDAEARYNVGKALLDMGQPEAAFAEWREALRLDPGHIAAYDNLAYALFKANRRDEAVQIMREAVRNVPESALLLSHFGNHLLSQADKKSDKATAQEALKALQKAVAIEPQNAHALHLLGVTQWRLGHRRQALETLKGAVAADPMERSTHFTLGRYQRRMLHGRGVAETVRALSRLSILEEEMRGYAQCWHRLTLFTGFLCGSAAAFLWLRKRQS